MIVTKRITTLPPMLMRQSWMISFNRQYTATSAAFTTSSPTPAAANEQTKSMLVVGDENHPSTSLNRIQEYYDDVLAEDLMILTYNHAHVNPHSPYRKLIAETNSDVNAEFREYVQAKRDQDAEDARNAAIGGGGSKKAANRAKRMREKAAEQAKQTAQKNLTDSSAGAGCAVGGYMKYLDPIPASEEELARLPAVIDRLPRLKEIRVDMIMPEAVSHSKKVLLNGLLALQMITGQHATVIKAQGVDQQLKARKGMPIGVTVRVKDEMLMYTFLEKLVELVLPRIRDFAGFSLHLGDENDGSIKLKFTAEAWQSFPEVETCYLKFPQSGSVGALCNFEMTLKSTSNDVRLTRLLLSGYRMPFSYREPVRVVEENQWADQQRQDETDIHDV